LVIDSATSYDCVAVSPVGAGFGFAPGATGETGGAAGLEDTELVLGETPPLLIELPVVEPLEVLEADAPVALAAVEPLGEDTVRGFGCFCWVKGSRAGPLGWLLDGELFTLTAAIGVPATGPWDSGRGAGGGACLPSRTGTATIAAIRASGTGQSRRWRRSVRIPLRKLIALGG
jgi:hypothetical protein